MRLHTLTSLLALEFFARALGCCVDRRTWLRGVTTSIGWMGICDAASAACLPGDLSPSCIGVYKVPMDESINDMISTKEALQKYAPTLNYVPPVPRLTTPKSARDAILAQRQAADDIVTVVSAGRLEEAGIKVLNLIPRVTVAGRILVENVPVDLLASSSSVVSLRRQQLQNGLDAAIVAWNDVDILIGQGIRGDLGVSAVAQIRILSELQDAIAGLDDFMAMVGTI
jgi:hypothetical protein